MFCYVLKNFLSEKQKFCSADADLLIWKFNQVGLAKDSAREMKMLIFIYSFKK